MVIEVQIKRPGGAGNRLLKFSQSPVRIGRNQLNDIPLEDPFVSEWHGLIRYDDRQIAYFDLGSTNGTLLDGKRLTKNLPAKLSEASRLQIGMLEISVVRRTDEAMSVEGAASRDDAGPGPGKTLGWRLGTPNTERLPGSAAGDSPRAARLDAASQTGPAAPGRGRMVTGPETPLPPSSQSQSARANFQATGGASPDLVMRQATFIEAFSEAFVGLRKGYEQFGAEVGVRTVAGSTPLHRARTARELVNHLMLANVDPTATARDLIAIFADFGIHHIALMEGITEGVRAVLQSLSPQANDLEGGGRLWTASKAKNQWKSYLERFELLVTDDEQLHAAIFGEAFARAYASVTLGKPRSNNSEDS